MEYSGFGLKNVKNRLDMLYKDKHKLVIKDNPGIFEVKLTLKE